MIFIFDGQTESLLARLDKRSGLLKAVAYEKLNKDFTLSLSVLIEYAEYLTKGNLVGYYDTNSNLQVFTIYRTTEAHDDSLVIDVECEHLYYELIDDIVEDLRVIDGDATQAITKALSSSRWQIGTVSNLGTQNINFYYSNALDNIRAVADKYKGDLVFRINYDTVNKKLGTRYVDLLSRSGVDTWQRFSYNKNITTIKRTVDLSEVKTALYGRGKSLETDEGGYSRKIDFGDEVWTTPTNPANKPVGQKWVGDTSALLQFGRNSGTRHRFGVVEFEEADNPNTLLWLTWNKLQEVNTPKVTYELDVVDLSQLVGYEHYKVNIGDTIIIVDTEFVPSLIVQARILEYEQDLLEFSNNRIILGSYKDSIVDIISSVSNGKDATQYFTWFKYADDQFGNGISDSPLNKKYLGVAYNKLGSIPSNVKEDYNWSLIQGIDGKSTITGVLTNESHSIPADKDGNTNANSFIGATTSLLVYYGIDNDTTNWTISVVKGVGVSGTLSGNTFTLTGLTTDIGYVDFTATKSGFTSITKRFTITKVKQGLNGTDGTSGVDSTVYRLSINTPVIVKTKDGVFNPTGITIDALSITGVNLPAAYNGRFIIQETTNGTTFVTKYTSSTDQSTKVYSPSSTSVIAIKVQLYKSGGTTTLVDSQLIPVAQDGVDGEDSYTISVEKPAVNVYITNTGTRISSAEWGSYTSRAASAVYVYKGKTLVPKSELTFTSVGGTGNSHWIDLSKTISSDNYPYFYMHATGSSRTTDTTPASRTFDIYHNSILIGRVTFTVLFNRYDPDWYYTGYSNFDGEQNINTTIATGNVLQNTGYSITSYFLDSNYLYWAFYKGQPIYGSIPIRIDSYPQTIFIEALYYTGTTLMYTQLLWSGSINPGSSFTTATFSTTCVYNQSPAVDSSVRFRVRFTNGIVGINRGTAYIGARTY